MRRLLAILVVLILAVPCVAGLRLKAGPQLWVYASRGDLASVRALVDSNAFDKDVLGRAMYNSLRRADLAKSPENLDIVRLFLSRGADPNYKALNGQTPLAAAVKGKNESAVQLLLENGADPAIADNLGKSPIDYARASGVLAIERLLASPPAVNRIAQVPKEPKVLNLDLSMEGANVFMTFDLVADEPVCVAVVGSLDKGATYDMKFAGASGDVGRVAPGNGKKIVWNSAVDYPSGFSEVDALIDIVVGKCE